MNSNIRKKIEEFYKEFYSYYVQFKHAKETDNITDEQYFANAIKFDMVSNALSVLTNIRLDNYLSAGIALNCRAIIEDLAVYKKYEKHELKEENYAVFRNATIFIEEADIMPILIKLGLDKEKLGEHITLQVLGLMEMDYEKIMKITGLNLKPLVNRLQEPDFYLSLGKFYKIIMPINHHLGKEFSELYQFLGIFSHPHFLNDNEKYRKVQNIKLSGIQTLMDLVQAAISQNDDLKIDSKKFLADPLYKLDYLKIIYLLKLINSILVSIQENGIFVTDFEKFTLLELKRLWYDTQLCYGLGYYEQVIIKFKTFIEDAAMFEIIRNLKDEDKNPIIKTLKARTIYNSIKIFDDIGNLDDYKSELKRLYKEYYEKKYALNNDEEFVKEISKLECYYLEKDKNKFDDVAQYYFENCATNDDLLLGYDFYKISLDYQHSNGYLYKSNKYLSMYFATIFIHYVEKYFINLFRQTLKFIQDENLGKNIEHFEEKSNDDCRTALLHMNYINQLLSDKISDKFKKVAKRKSNKS